MKLSYKKIVAGVFGLVFVVTAVFLFAGSVQKDVQVLQTVTESVAEDVAKEPPVYINEPAYATVVPNDLTVTMLSSPVAAEYEPSSFQDKVVAYVDEFLPVRTEATRDSQTIGKMYPGCVAEVIERGEVWSKVRSGNVEGYIQNMYVCFDAEAEDLAILLGGEEELITAITIEEEEAKKAELAKKAAEEAAAKAAAEKAAKEAAAKAAAEKAAKEAAERAAAEKAAKEAAEKAAAEKASQEAVQKAAAEKASQEAVQNEAVETVTQETMVPEAAVSETVAETQPAQEVATVSPYYMELSEEDIYLIACIVDWEANAEVYEGKLAVANVILNRVRSGVYPNTVSGVIYQRSQFSGVLDSSGNYSTRWQARLANGPRNEECYQAARDAAAGINNVIGYYSFNGTKYCNLASFKSYIIIGNHCFYQR